MKRAKQVLHAFKVEMRDVPRVAMGMYEARYKEHHETLKALNGDLEISKQDVERTALGVRSVDEMTPAQILEVAGKTQDQSLASTRRMQQRIAESKQIGSETAMKLKSQTEQCACPCRPPARPPARPPVDPPARPPARPLAHSPTRLTHGYARTWPHPLAPRGARRLKDIDTDILKVKSNLNRADLLVRAFIRKMATDKIIVVLICLIFIALIAVIAYSILKPKDENNSPTPAVNTQTTNLVGSLDRARRALGEGRGRASVAELFSAVGALLADAE